jgi:hypothetical protein
VSKALLTRSTCLVDKVGALTQEGGKDGLCATGLLGTKPGGVPNERCLYLTDVLHGRKSGLGDLAECLLEEAGVGEAPSCVDAQYSDIVEPVLGLLVELL